MDDEQYDAAYEAVNRLYSKLAEGLRHIDREDIGDYAVPLRWFLEGTWNYEEKISLKFLIQLDDKLFQDVITVLTYLRSIPYRDSHKTIGSMLPGGKFALEKLLRKAGYF